MIRGYDLEDILRMILSNFVPEDPVEECEKICKEFFDKVEDLHCKLDEKFKENIKQYAKIKRSKVKR